MALLLLTLERCSILLDPNSANLQARPWPASKSTKCGRSFWSQYTKQETWGAVTGMGTSAFILAPFSMGFPIHFKAVPLIWSQNLEASILVRELPDVEVTVHYSCLVGELVTLHG